jgi:hypothetical protein
MNQTCLGCQKEIWTPDGVRICLCSDCRPAMYESLAHAIEPAYDPAQPQTWERCSESIGQLYGRVTLRDPNTGVAQDGWEVPVRVPQNWTGQLPPAKDKLKPVKR